MIITGKTTPFSVSGLLDLLFSIETFNIVVTFRENPDVVASCVDKDKVVESVDISESFVKSLVVRAVDVVEFSVVRAAFVVKSSVVWAVGVVESSVVKAVDVLKSSVV